MVGGERTEESLNAFTEGKTSIFSVPFEGKEEVYKEAEETAEKGPEADTQSQQENEEASVSDEDITDGIDSDMEI